MNKTKKYTVTLTYQYEETIDVEASDTADAYNKARDTVDDYNDELELTEVTAHFTEHSF